VVPVKVIGAVMVNRPGIFEGPWRVAWTNHTVYAGLAITAHDESQVSEAKFPGLRIEAK
jgi:hypothetical protein